MPSFAKIYSLESFSLVTDTQLRLLKVISSQNVCSQNVVYFVSLFLTGLPTYNQTKISQTIKRIAENCKEKLRRALELDRKIRQIDRKTTVSESLPKIFPFCFFVCLFIHLFNLLIIYALIYLPDYIFTNQSIPLLAF